MKCLSYSNVISKIREYGKNVLLEKNIKVHFSKLNTVGIKNSDDILTYGKNNAYCTESAIYIFTKEFYDSPEIMALCFSHEVCHLEDMQLKEYENEFADELRTWGRTFKKLYEIFGIKPSKQLQDIIVKSLKEYNKIKGS